MPRAPKKNAAMVEAAVAAEELKAEFPVLGLPVQPPFEPMDARAVKQIPSEGKWLYEPKWDGFRCLAFRNGNQVVLQSKAGQPLGRYFPELVQALLELPAQKFVIDGEIVVFDRGQLSFDDLLMRIHPAASRIARLSRETPATFLVFDVLLNSKGNYLNAPLCERRERLKEFFDEIGTRKMVRMSPASTHIEKAEEWMREQSVSGLDGVIAKLLDEPYHSGDRKAVVKIKRLRTADCVVGGFRYAQKGGQVGSLLLGLYNDAGELDHVGFSSSFTREERALLEGALEKYKGGAGFTGKAPGGPSRWATERSAEWVPLQPKLVCEVQYDHVSGGRFRHGTKFLRWRPDKEARACTFDQVLPRRGGKGIDEIAA